MKQVTKKLIENIITMQLGLDPTSIRFNKIDDNPPIWKHACEYTGITLREPIHETLNLYNIGVGNVVDISYIYCGSCGTVTYYYEKIA